MVQNNQNRVQEIILHKHDIALRLRSIVIDPLEEMNENGVADASFFENEGKVNRDLLDKLELLRKDFREKWDDDNLSDEENIERIRKNLTKVQNVYIPLVRSVSDFYKRCLDKDHYFSRDSKGENAKLLMKQSVNRIEDLCKDLEKMVSLEPECINADSFNLLTSLQYVLDKLKADVRYVDEVRLATYYCSSDIKAFQNHVLENLRENIDTHAFGTKAYRMKHMWEKEVIVTVSDDAEFYTICIANNGEPFSGDTSKVFAQGYHHGEMQHTGIGLYSAMKTMRSLGGDISFEKITDTIYTTRYTLKLPKSYGEI